MTLTKPADQNLRCSVQETTGKIVDERFPGLSDPVRLLLTQRPDLFEFLLQLDHGLAKGDFTNSDLNRLAEGWSERLPLQHGAIIYQLRDFLEQPELELGFQKPKGERAVHKAKRQKHRPG